MVKYVNYKDPDTAARMMAQVRERFADVPFGPTAAQCNSATVAAALGITKRLGVHFCELYRRERLTGQATATDRRPSVWAGGSKLFRVQGVRLFVLDPCQCRQLPPKKRSAWCQHCDGSGSIEREIPTDNPITQARRDYAKVLAEQYQDRLAERIQEQQRRKLQTERPAAAIPSGFGEKRRRGRPRRKFARSRFAC